MEMEENGDMEQEEVTGSPTAGENEFVHIDSVDSAPTDAGSINQEDDGVVVARADSVQNEPNDSRVTEEGGNEEFMDCPDDLVAYEGRTPTSVVENREAEVTPEGAHMIRDTMEDAQNSVSNSERETFPQPHQEERRALMEELTNLCHQLKALNKQHSPIDENGGGLSNDQLTSDAGEGDESSLLPVREIINECSKFIEFTLHEQSQSEGKIRELYVTSSVKDSEIEHLNAKANEHSVSVEATTDRILSHLETVLGREELSDTSVGGKFSHIEKQTNFLTEMYVHFLSEVQMFRECLAEVTSDSLTQMDTQKLFFSVREELLELKRKEVELAHKVSYLEDEHGKLMQQLEKGRETIEMLNAEVGKLKGEVEQEKTRCSNTKEKLSMAVTKGKSLVQQRDSLKQAITEKTNELDRCLVELQEKSSALEAAELRNKEIMRVGALANSLQEALSQRDMVLGKCEEILSFGVAAQELHSSNIIEKVTWLANERNRLAPVSLEFQKLTDALSLLELPEAIRYSNLGSQVNWLLESFYLAKDQSTKLLDEINTTREVARAEIDRLTVSLLVEAQEKNYLQEEIEDLTHKYEIIAAEKCQVCLEKEQMVTLLLNASGISNDILGDKSKLHNDMPHVIDKCLSKIKEHAIASPESPLVETEILEKVQDVLYARDQECKLYEQILEDEKMDRLQMGNRLNEIVKVSEELRRVKVENGSLKVDLQRFEEKAGLLREKLSMAVKKGKGLVQEREYMKQQMAEKNAEIEALKRDLQQRESTLSDCRDQVNKLSTDVEHTAKDLLHSKEERNQIEQFLVESNTMLRRIFEAIDGIILPVDLQDPAEKVKWCATYLHEGQVAKAQAEQELEDVKGEASMLASKLNDAVTTMKSLENALSVSDKNVTKLIEEKEKLEFSKSRIEEELHKAMEDWQVSKAQAEHEVRDLKEEVSTLNKKLVDTLTSLKSLEGVLPGSEKRELEVSRSYVEEKLHKAMEEANSQSSKCEEVFTGKNSLQEALSLVMTEKEEAQASKVAAEMELQKVKEEVSVHAVKLDEARKTIKFLEDTVSQLQTHVFESSHENEKGEDSRTVLEIEIKKLKEEAESHEYKVKTLENALLKAENTVSDLVGEKKNAEQEISTLNTQLSACRQELAGNHDTRAMERSALFDNLQMSLKDGTLLTLFKQSFEKQIERLKEMDRHLRDLRGTFDSEQLQDYSDIEESFQLSTLHPADSDNVLNFDTIHVELNAADANGIGSYVRKTFENLNLRNQILADEFGRYSRLIDVLIASLLKKLESMRNSVPFQSVIDHYSSAKNNNSTTIEELKDELEKTRSLHDKVQEENDTLQSRVFKLETELEVSQNRRGEISFKLEDYRAKADKRNEREVELSKQNTASINTHEAENALLSASRIKTLFNKIHKITTPYPNVGMGDLKPQDSDPVEKLFYLVDNVNELLDQMTLLSHANEELHSTLSKQAIEVEYLKGKLEETINGNQDFEPTKKELLELSTGLERLIQKIGGYESGGSKKSGDFGGLLPVLERLVQGIILDSENSKSRAQDLGAKLLETQRVAEELANKVKVLEDFSKSQRGSSEKLQGRGVFEASEIEDPGPVGKTAMPLVPSAAHVRTLRRGSSNDQLSIVIDSESDRLIDKKETVEDKGHVFKSLHTSGLVPVQGRMIADRLDGVW